MICTFGKALTLDNISYSVGAIYREIIMEVIGERSDVKEAHSRERRQVAAQRDTFTHL